MSVIVMGYVWGLDLPAKQKFVLLAYADHADHEGNNIFPANDTVANKTGMSVRTVQRLKKELINDGIMIEDGWYKYENNSTKLYRIPMDKKRGDKMTYATPQDIGVTQGAERGDTGVIQTVLNHQEPSLKDNNFSPLSYWLNLFKWDKFPDADRFIEGDSNLLCDMLDNAYSDHGEDKFKKVAKWVWGKTQHKYRHSYIYTFCTTIDKWDKKEEKSFEQEVEDAGYV